MECCDSTDYIFCIDIILCQSQHEEVKNGERADDISQKAYFMFATVKGSEHRDDSCSRANDFALS